MLPRAKPPASGGRADEWQSRPDHALWLAIALGIDERRTQWRRTIAGAATASATGVVPSALASTAAAAGSSSSGSALSSSSSSSESMSSVDVSALAESALRELLQFAIAGALVQSAQVLDAVRLSSSSSLSTTFSSSDDDETAAASTANPNLDAASAAAASLLTRIHELSTGGWAGVSESVFANFLLPRALLHHQLCMRASDSDSHSSTSAITMTTASAALAAVQPAVDLLESVRRTETRVAALLRLSAARANTLVYEVQRPVYQRLVAGHADRLSDRPIGAFTNARLHEAFAADVGAHLLETAMALLPWMAARSASARHKEARRLNASACLARTRFAFDTLFAHHAALRAGVVGVFADLVARSLRHLLSISHSTNAASAVSGSVSSATTSATVSQQYAPMAVAHALIALWTSMHELPVLLWPACGAPVRAAFEQVCASLADYSAASCNRFGLRIHRFFCVFLRLRVLDLYFCLSSSNVDTIRPCIARGTPSGARRAPRPPFATRRLSLTLWTTRSMRRVRGRRPLLQTRMFLWSPCRLLWVVQRQPLEVLPMSPSGVRGWPDSRPPTSSLFAATRATHTVLRPRRLPRPLSPCHLHYR